MQNLENSLMLFLRRSPYGEIIFYPFGTKLAGYLISSENKIKKIKFATYVYVLAGMPIVAAVGMGLSFSAGIPILVVVILAQISLNGALAIGLTKASCSPIILTKDQKAEMLKSPLHYGAIGITILLYFALKFTQHS